MILGDHGPQSTITEDLTALGMEHLLEGHGGKKKKKGGYGKDKMSDDDEPASPRQPIPVRQEDDDEDDDEIDEDEFEIDEDNDEIDLDEDEVEALRDALIEYAQEQDYDQEQYEEMLENESFISEFATVFFEDEDEDEDEDDGEDDPKQEAAWGVVESFQQKLISVQEGNEDARPGYDDLVGVIEAYEYITEVRFGKRGGKQAKGMKRARKRGKAKRMGKKRAMAAKQGKHFIKGQKQTTTQVKKALRQSIKGSTGRFKKSQREKLKHIGDIQAGDEEAGGTPISELVDNLNALREAVRAPTEENEDSSGETLVEGLKAIHDTAVMFYERIASELREDEDEEVDESDGRVAVGRHLEKIAEDANDVACGIVEGTSDLDDAAGDLQNLAADLNDVMEAMKAIE